MFFFVNVNEYCHSVLNALLGAFCVCVGWCWFASEKKPPLFRGFQLFLLEGEVGFLGKPLQNAKRFFFGFVLCVLCAGCALF